MGGKLYTNMPIVSKLVHRFIHNSYQNSRRLLRSNREDGSKLHMEVNILRIATIKGFLNSEFKTNYKDIIIKIV